jgi:copper chaperone NosL
MKISLSFIALLLAAALPVGGCSEEQSAAPPAPHKLTADAVGHYCGMDLLEHSGPKGQIILASQTAPVWFSSARDAFSYTMLDEEAKDVRAVYVSDMGKAPSWEKPGVDNWIEARSAFFVIGSSKQGGMGAPETVPFSTRAAADRFVAEHGGKIVAFGEVPRDYVLSSESVVDGGGGAVHPHHDAEAAPGEGR